MPRHCGWWGGTRRWLRWLIPRKTPRHWRPRSCRRRSAIAPKVVAVPEAYVPQDALSLWWLGDPAQPRPIGTLHLAGGGRSVALAYGAGWLEQGFALSDDLPLRPGLFVPPEKDLAAGAVDDARPDRWGERVIRKFERSPRLSLLEFLLFAGD